MQPVVKIDDSQIVKFLEQAPQRGKWALAEALKMTGGHLRGKIRTHIARGGELIRWRIRYPPGR